MDAESGKTANTSDATFASDVIERSRDLPIVVDFWAPWCQPCRLLAPSLEKVASEFEGRVALIKANIDTMPATASRLGIASIPAVLGFRDGRVVNSFVGVLAESYIRDFFQGLLPTPVELLVREGAALEAQEPEQAAERYRAALALAGPLDAAPRIALARVLLTLGRNAESQTLIDELEARGYLEPEAESLKAKLLLSLAPHDRGSLDDLRKKADANVADLGAKLLLAEALAADHQYAEALELALDLVERDRKNTGEAARKLMLAIFNLVPNDPLSTDYRRKLSFVV